METAKIKPRYDPVKAMAVKQTAEKFSVTPQYVRMIENGDREDDEIKAHYRKLYKTLSEALTA